jgi:hypothetical protein
VFGFVDTGRLGLAVKPQSDGVFQEQGQDSGDNRRVPQNREGSYGLAPQLVGATAVEQAGDRRGRLRRRDEADKLAAQQIQNENQAAKERQDLLEKQIAEERQTLTAVNAWQQSIRLTPTSYALP